VVARDERQVRERIKEMLESRANDRNATIWPENPGQVDDKVPSFLVAYLPLEFGAAPKAEQESLAKAIFEKHGDRPRQYRNGIGLAVPTGEQIEVLRRAVRYLMAIQRIKQKAKQLNLTAEQKAQLNEREATEKAAAESAFLKLYTEVWLPRLPKEDEQGLQIDVVSVGGRPLQTTLNENREARVHDRVMELLLDLHRRLFTSLNPVKIVDLFKLGEGTPPVMGIRTSDVVDGFYSFLGFTRLATSAAIRKSIAQGVRDGMFGYCSGSVPSLAAGGKYQVPLGRVRLGAAVTEDEIDLESGFLMMPQAVPQAAPPPAEAPGAVSPAGPAVATGPWEPGVGPSPGITPSVGPSPPGAQTLVEIQFSADRNKLFDAWNAVANLADLAGTVSVTIRAESNAGFDRSKLDNGVFEPLREADLIS